MDRSRRDMIRLLSPELHMLRQGRRLGESTLSGATDANTVSSTDAVPGVESFTPVETPDQEAERVSGWLATHDDEIRANLGVPPAVE